MSGVNKVILVGNLGKDPEVRHLESGVPVATFPIATSESYKDKDGNRVDKTEWHNIVLWRGLAEVAGKYLKKGQQVFIEGKIRTRTYQDKDNQTRYTTEIVGDNMTMLGGRSGDGNDQGSGYGSSQGGGYQSGSNQNAGNSNMGSNNSSADNEPDDLPF